VREANTSQFGLGSLVRMRGAPLIEALDRHLPGSREHAEATASYAFATAVELRFDRSRSELVREAAKLHDVGKLYVPARLLTEDPASLSDADRAQLDGESEAAYHIAQGAGIAANVSDWIRRAGRRFDGAGNEGPAEEAIPIESRIIRAACACDSVLARSDAAAGADLDTRRGNAIIALKRQSGTELDPRVVAAFAAVLDRATASASGMSRN
jgi:HD-GYP domain-containing protein (c-di-GMP phosphodiesterase class II)